MKDQKLPVADDSNWLDVNITTKVRYLKTRGLEVRLTITGIKELDHAYQVAHRALKVLSNSPIWKKE